MKESLCPYSISDQYRLIRQMLAQLGLPVREDAVAALQRFYELLIDRNRSMNLTAITDFEDVVEKHFADSLLVAQVTDLNGVRSLIDIGTGAGFPGIPIKILFPDIQVVLLDSLQKRVGFLNEGIAQLALKGIRAVHGRAEDFGRDALYREQFDLCVSRAVADLRVLSEYCIPFIKKGGQFVAYKSAGAVRETNEAGYAIRILGGAEPQICSARLPGCGQNRLFIKVRKDTSTPERYPRRAGMPARRPL